MQINIVDSIMGAGKTTAAINYINQSSEEKRFMYVTPYLDEVERIIKECPAKNFKQPERYNDKLSKLISLKNLLNKGANIVTTHVLFHLFDDEIIDLCYSQGYILIMDEVTDVIEQYYINRDDLQILLDNFVTVKENKLLEWRSGCTDYNGRFEDEKRLCEMECLALYGNSVMMWMFPTKIFNAFRESYILTYMFQAQLQKYYYDFYGMEYKYLYITGDSIETYFFTEISQNYKHKYNYKQLITIYDDEKLNMIGDADTALSKTWYSRNKDNNLLKQLKNNTLNFFNNKMIVYTEDGEWVKSKSDNNIWTTFKDFKDKIAGKGYSKGFVPSNMRATNNYRTRTAIAYLVNKYFNPLVKQFFETHGVTVYEDEYAISEMLQFIWRSAIRDGKHITVYIPSKRMRTLLQKWIDEQEYDTV